VDLCRLGMQQELKNAGLGEVARVIRDGWQSVGKDSDPEMIEFLSVLQFVQDWSAT